MDLAAPAGLSQRGDKNAAVVNGSLKNLLEIFRDQYDPKTNPSGIVIVGVADNSLMRKEVLRWINSDRLKLQPAELTYGDRIFSSTRLVNALCSLFNEVPMGLDTEKPKLIKQVVPDDIVVGSGATGILDALFTVLCNPGDGVLLSVPSYNGFDHDLTARAEAKIIEVHTPLPEAYNPAHKPQQPSRAFTPDTVKAYEDALAQARKDGVKVTSILVCNPHNPTGLVYPRETLVALAKLAAKESLHLVVDEIYARSVFSSPDISDADATHFHSILTVDVEKEAGLPRANVHVVSSISKDFGANGFRLGVYVNQGGQDVVAAMSSLGILSQSSSPAGALWYLWLEDRAKGGFLPYFFAENHRRMSIAYRYLTQWAQRQGIRYVAANSGHFVMLDLRPYLGVKGGDDGDDAARKAETDLSQRFIDARVFVAPGAQYHHPQPGWFRFTFSLELGAVRVGLQRMEKVLGLESKTEAAPDVERDAIPLPPSLQAVVNQDLGAERPTPTLGGELPDAQVLTAISQRQVDPLVALVSDGPARKTHRVLSSIAHNILLSALAQPHHIDDLVTFFLSLIAPIQRANSALVGLEREPEFLKSGMRPAEGAGQSLLEHMVAEIHTACLQLSTNASTPHPKDAQLDANYWRRAVVYGLILGRLFASDQAEVRTRSWSAVEDLLLKSLLSPANKSGGPPSPGVLLLLPTCLLVSAPAVKAQLAQRSGRGKHFLWYDSICQRPEDTWAWSDVVEGLRTGIDKQLNAAIGVSLPREAGQEWDRAREWIEGRPNDSKSVAEVLDDVRWAFE